MNLHASSLNAAGIVLRADGSDEMAPERRKVGEE
jgi:hypothetical protein